MKKKLLVASAATLSIGLALGAFAHSGAMGIVKERMDGMMVMGKSMKSIAMMVKGVKDYDADTIKAAAAAIEKHSGENMTKLFPKGEKKQKVSVAKDEIWTNWEEFEALSMRLQILSQGLAASADKGLSGASDSMMGNSSMMGSGSMMSDSNMPTMEMMAGMSPNMIFPMIAGTCSSCHTKFRTEK